MRRDDGDGVETTRAGAAGVARARPGDERTGRGEGIGRGEAWTEA